MRLAREPEFCDEAFFPEWLHPEMRSAALETGVNVDRAAAHGGDIRFH